MSGRIKVRVRALAGVPYLLDHLVGARLHRRRHVDAEPLGRREIDDQFKLSRLQNWQFGEIFRTLPV